MYYARWGRLCAYAPVVPSQLTTKHITMSRSSTRGETTCFVNLFLRKFSLIDQFSHWLSVVPNLKTGHFDQLKLFFWLVSSISLPPPRGFSYVDLVEGAKDGRFYALKRILCHDREGRQEAQTEVDMHQVFNHPNVLSLVAHAFVDRSGKTEAWLLLPYMRVS